MEIRTTLIAALLCAAPIAAAAAPAGDDSYAATAYGGRTLSPAYHRCVGSYASNAEIGRCLEAEADRQDAALNAAYRRKMAALPPPRRAALRASERVWVKQRERRCQQDFDAMEGGTGAGPSQLSCLANRAILRIRWIEGFR
jgi:uncharacterized protein YecT (DUF1311 family)